MKRNIMKADRTMERVKELAGRITEFTGVKLEKVEYVREYGKMVLRIIISKEGGVSTEDCESVSRALSKKLDEIDMIKEHYFLEVSSPGIGEDTIHDQAES